MNALTQTVLPIFAVLLAGYICGKSKLIPENGTETINAFVYFFALPTLFILFLSDTDIRDIFNMKAIATFLGTQLLMMGLIILLAVKFFPQNNNGENAMQGMAGIFSNTGYLGIPLMITAFGAEHTNIAILTTIINGAITLPLTLCLLEAAKIKELGTNTKKTIVPMTRVIGKSLATNPLLIGAAIGIFMSALEIKSTGSVRVFLELSGQAASPAALFAMGLFLATQRIKQSGHHRLRIATQREIAYMSGVKIIIHPLLTFLIGTYLIGLNEVDMAATVIMAALPTGGLVFLLAERQNCYKDKSASIILVSTILSVISVSFLVQHYTPVFAG